MKKYVIISIITIILMLLYSRFIATSGLKVNEYKIINNNIIEEYHGLKIVQISDIHYGSTVNEKKLKKIVDEINKSNPDIVTLTGDLIDERIEYDKDIIIKHLSNINAKLGKYAVSGNHDMPIESFNELIEKSGFKNLNNTYELIYDNSNKPIVISGISSNISDTTEIGFKTESFDNYISSITDDTKPIYSILLIHEPDYINNLKLNNYNLILSGHSHGGQVRLPLIGKIHTPHGAKKYYDECYKIDNTELYISNGIGTSGLKFRLFSRPSFNFFRVTNK